MKHILPILGSLKQHLAHFAKRAVGLFGRLFSSAAVRASAPAVLKGALLLLLLVFVPVYGSGLLPAFEDTAIASPTAAITHQPGTATPIRSVAATPTAKPDVTTLAPVATLFLSPAPSPSLLPATPAPTKKTAAPHTITKKPAATPAPSKSIAVLRVYKGSQTVVAIRMEGGKETAARVMICSTGRTSGLTPNGTFKIYAKYAYRQLQGAMGQYCSRFNGGILFHSVPIDNGAKKMSVGKSRMKISNYNKLGSMDSDGCVRLLVRDALWIYNNCPKGTRVEVVSGSSPFGTGSKPVLKSGPPYTSVDGQYGWDPTDPDSKNPYRNTTSTPKPSPAATPAASDPPSMQPTTEPHSPVPSSATPATDNPR